MFHHTLLQAAEEWGASAVVGGGGWWFFSTAVRTMPKPLPTDSRWFVWLYDFLQTIAANHDLKVKPNG